MRFTEAREAKDVREWGLSVVGFNYNNCSTECRIAWIRSGVERVYRDWRSLFRCSSVISWICVANDCEIGTYFLGSADFHI